MPYFINASSSAGFISSPFSLSPRKPKQAKCRAALRSSSSPDVSVENTIKIQDGTFAKLCIATFRSIMQPRIGWTSPRSGYDGFIEECRMLLAKKSPEEQQRIATMTLDTVFRAPLGPPLFRKYFSDKPRMNAMITPLFFKWLVGHCYTNRPEEGGYGVFIEKCRFLEESGCKGLCVNMCQQPTQRYFTEQLGLPVRMTPDYEKMSCQMSFGVHPLPIHEDPAVSGDCLANCKMSSSAKRQENSRCYVTKDDR